MDLDLVCKGFGAAISAVSGLRFYSEIPNKFNTPCAVVGLGKGDQTDYAGDLTVEFGVLILISTANTRGAQEAIRGYLVSVPDALEADNTLPYNGAATASSVDFQGWDSPAVYTVGDIEYLGVELHFEVM